MVQIDPIIGAIAAASIPVLGLVWQLWTGRVERASRELANLDQIIDAATKRDDPIQFAYRALAYEHLVTRHQRDRTRSGAFSSVWWGSYAVVMIFLLFQGPYETPIGLGLVGALFLTGFLALRGV